MYSDKSEEQMYCDNIRQIFEGCRQTLNDIHLCTKQEL